MSTTSTPPAVAAFRALHESGCFVMPNPWDAGSAVYLAHLGFDALATTSAGMAFARGLPDAPGAVSLEEVLRHLAEIVGATRLPVSADFQSGFARELEDLAKNVTRCAETGVAGLSIEDATGDTRAPIFERSVAIDRVRTARAAIDATGVPIVLTARCEAWLVREPEPARVALDRLVAFADAGADCLHAPGVTDPAIIASLVEAVAPRPLNVLVSSPAPGLTVRRLEDLGVRRISVGSALARVAWKAFMRAAADIAATGAFDSLGEAASFAEIDALLSQRSRG